MKDLKDEWKRFNESEKLKSAIRKMETPALKKICEEFDIPWTDKVEDVYDMVDKQIERGLYLEQLQKDL